MRPLPIRLRLTLWYSLMFTAAALVLGLTTWWMLHAAIAAGLHQDLQERIDDVREQLKQDGPGVPPEERQRRFDAIYKYRDDGKWLQIMDDKGIWVYRSARMVSSGASLPLAEYLPAEGLSSYFHQGSRHVRAFASAVVIDGRAYSVQAGISTSKSEALLERFKLGLLILTPGIVLVAVFAGHLMSRKALSPVTLIASEARRISDKNLAARLPVYETGDEIAHLSSTLNDMLARIDKGFHSVRDFTANASHELRTPLARIRAEAEIALLSTRSAAEYQDSLEHLQKTAIEMGELLESLLALARADAGCEDLQLSSVNLEELIEAGVQEWRPVAKRLSVKLESTITSSSAFLKQPLYVLANHLALLRLLRIWLDNACKFTPPGGTITISSETKGNSVALAVTDTGIGIPEEHHRHVFERFYRVQGDTTRVQRGAGLGLSLAAWIAKQHGSTVVLTSEAGKGSRMEITLPLADPLRDEHSAKLQCGVGTRGTFQPASSS